MTDTAPKFARVGNVALPTFKIEEGTPRYFRVLKPISVEMGKETVNQPDHTGRMVAVDVPKEIHVMEVQDLANGKSGKIVVGAVLKSELEKYKGGNSQYVALCFEIIKSAAKPGSRAKLYEIYEIADPDHK